MSVDKKIRQRPSEPPQGLKQLRWFGPGLIWMVSSVGSGSVLFTPRVGSRYEYALLWAALVVIVFMWVMIREVGRYTVVTGESILDGYRNLPGPKGWAIWLIFVPQLIAAAVTIAGIAALVGSALMIALPGSQVIYAASIIIISAALVVTGHYKGVERITLAMAAVLVGASVIAAGLVTPQWSAFTAGILPTIPDGFDLYFVLPWFGFILAGAAGVMWFSYWVATRGFGGPVPGLSENGDGWQSGSAEADDKLSEEEQVHRIQSWLRIMSWTAAVGVIGGGLVIVSFLVLGTELLAPEGIVPSGVDAASDLTRLLSEIWGAFGYWLLISGIVVALWGTILANQDGWGRMFADATIILAQTHRGERSASGGNADFVIAGKRLRHGTLKNAYSIVVVTIIPLALFFLLRNPVDILSVGGIIAAAHTPVVVLLTLLLNKRTLPKGLQPGILSSAVMVLSGLFFTAFAVIYFLSLLGVQIW